MVDDEGYSPASAASLVETNNSTILKLLLAQVSQNVWLLGVRPDITFYEACRSLNNACKVQLRVSLANWLSYSCFVQDSNDMNMLEY